MNLGVKLMLSGLQNHVAKEQDENQGMSAAERFESK